MATELIKVGRLIEILQGEDPEAIVVLMAPDAEGWVRGQPPLMADRALGYMRPNGTMWFDLLGGQGAPGLEPCVRLWPVA